MQQRVIQTSYLLHLLLEIICLYLCKNKKISKLDTNKSLWWLYHKYLDVESVLSCLQKIIQNYLKVLSQNWSRKKCCSSIQKRWSRVAATLQTNFMITDEQHRPILWINTTDQFHDYRSTLQTNFMTRDQHYKLISRLQINTKNQFHDYRSTLQTNFMTADQHCRPIS